MHIICPPPQVECRTTTKADTGAKVFIAGCPLLRDLGISLHYLQPSPKTVTHIAGGVKLVGNLLYQVTMGMNTTQEYVCTLQRECNNLYLSLGACKALQLVPQAFPWLKSH